MSTQIATTAQALAIAGHAVLPGARRSLDLPAVLLPTGSSLSLPIQALCGNRPGPTLWLSATTHGEELNGLEVVHRVMKSLSPDGLAGSIIAVPVMNVLGFMTQTRTLPDGSDLNRSFPGSPQGSVAERLANFFMQEIVSQCDYGIDLHSGANNRLNPPQIRADLHDPQTRRLAEAFAAPVMMNFPAAAGSLRKAAMDVGKPMLLFEGGEPLRSNLDSIEAGEAGVLRVMAELGMIDEGPPRPSARSIEVSSDHTWIKAPRCGILRPNVKVLDKVREGDLLGTVADVLGDHAETLKAPFDGIVIGKSLNLLVAKGEGVLHLAKHLE